MGDSMHASYLKLLMAAALAAALFARQANAEPKPGESPAPAETAIEESSPADLNALAESLEKSFADQPQTEAVRMLIAIARGSQMGPGEGWFGPGQSRYTWDWLVRAQGLEGAKEIAKRQFRGSEEWFERLDRNRNGRIVARSEERRGGKQCR